ncbi:MAG: hypothetical protein EBY09_18605, partial [Verrucomicrobia bacterium]|nr:hypothetical protein [Verrucomicrobiota bacterium]
TMPPTTNGVPRPLGARGDAAQLISPSAVQVPSLHSAEPATVTSIVARASMQAPMSLESTYCPLQKSAPSGFAHCALQPPETSTWQPPSQSMRQSMFASAVQLPSQLALHLALQSALGGAISHLALQLPLHVEEQVLLHCVLLPLDAHLASQLRPQSALHDAVQSNLPGSTVHWASHPPVQSTLQPMSSFALQVPSHFASDRDSAN